MDILEEKEFLKWNLARKLAAPLHTVWCSVRVGSKSLCFRRALRALAEGERAVICPGQKAKVFVFVYIK